MYFVTLSSVLWCEDLGARRSHGKDKCPSRPMGVPSWFLFAFVYPLLSAVD